jgi:hypothetical protein
MYLMMFVGVVTTAVSAQNGGCWRDGCGATKDVPAGWSWQMTDDEKRAYLNQHNDLSSPDSGVTVESGHSFQGNPDIGFHLPSPPELKVPQTSSKDIPSGEAGYRAACAFAPYGACAEYYPGVITPPDKVQKQWKDKTVDSAFDKMKNWTSGGSSNMKTGTSPQYTVTPTTAADFNNRLKASSAPARPASVPVGVTRLPPISNGGGKCIPGCCCQ